jgi:deoxyribose-phosphate aldolase
MLNTLEIDVMQANELIEASQITAKYHLPAIVVHQDLSSEAYILRAQLNSKYKIITPIDWPKGNNFGILKLRGLSTDALEVEGFEILLTGGKSLNDSKNEARLIIDFIRNHLSELHEIRFVLGTSIRDEDNIKIICEALQSARSPSFIRNDTQLKTQVNKANPEIHNSTIQLISSIVKAPLKVSGNISNFKTLTQCRSAKRFGVSLSQAKTIIKEYKSQPSDQLKKLLYGE